MRRAALAIGLGGMLAGAVWAGWAALAADIVAPPEPPQARLRIGHLPAEPLAVTVYDRRAASFGRPRLEAKGVGADGLRVPAGELLVVLSAGGRAPDLHRVSAAPGETVIVDYVPRKGWSLVLRCRGGSKASKPVPSAVVALTSVQGYGRPDRALGESTAGADGLVLWPGLRARGVTAAVRHPAYLPGELPGIAAAPGALAIRDVALEEGGTVRARVAVDGRPRAGALCKVLELQPPPAVDPKTWKPKVFYEGRTDRQGSCRSGRLRSGPYELQVALRDGDDGQSREVAVADGMDAEEELAFTEIRVSGTVTRGERSVPGLVVEAFDSELFKRVAGAVTREDGTYDFVLWKPGFYIFFLKPSAETRAPLAWKHETVAADPDGKTVDFALESTTLRGRVVDEDGKPVERASVTLRWTGRPLKGTVTDGDGRFEIFLESKGQGDVTAKKEGYEESSPSDVALAEDAGDTSDDPLPPVTVVLRKLKSFRGTLATAAGVPVPGARVWALHRVLGDEYVQSTQGQTSADGRFEVAPMEGRPNRLFASGPGCPLTPFDPVGEDGELALRCDGQPAVLDLTLKDPDGRPVTGARLILRRGGAILPENLLVQHLAQLGLPAETDPSGRLVVPNLAPGDYDLFLDSSVTEGMIEVGSRTGYLGSAHLAPLATTELPLSTALRPQAP